MRKLILLFAAAMVSMAAFAAERNAVCVTLNSGDKAYFLFDDKPELTFPDGSLQIATANKVDPAYFNIDDVSSVVFEEYSSVDKLKSTGIVVAYSAEGVAFHNIGINSRVSVADINGRIIVSCVADESYSLSRASFNHGVYIVKINNYVIKITL